jgi:tetratricopeptide (TPR) repeat protein
MMLRDLLGVLALSVVLAACGGRDSVLVDDEPAPKVLDDASQHVAEGDAHWAHRDDAVRVNQAIIAWEKAAGFDRTRADIQLKLSYAYFWKAHGHLRFAEDEPGMLTFFDKGVVAAERALKLLSPAFAERVKAGSSWQDALEVCGQESLPALYWYASNLGKWALLEGIVKTLSFKDRIAAIMEHCKGIDETFWYGGPHRYFGVYRTKIPFPGGDLEASKEHFERAAELAPGYLETKVLFASEYAAKAQDEELYKKLLQEVIAAPGDIEPALVPENAAAKRTAKSLLENIEDYF